MVRRLRQCLVFFGCVTIAFASVGEARTTGKRVGSCSTLTNAYGPFDYTNPKLRAEKLPIVEKHHFAPYAYNLRGGLTNRTRAADLDYAFRAVPNHHLAMEAMARLHRRANAEKLDDANVTLSCYFELSHGFAPNDPVDPIVECVHYPAAEGLSAVENALLRALDINAQSPEAAYNLGLPCVRKGESDQARIYAAVAYDNGHPLPGFKNQLIDKSAWFDETDKFATR
jgi:hypothetical protein